MDTLQPWEERSSSFSPSTPSRAMPVCVHALLGADMRARQAKVRSSGLSWPITCSTLGECTQRPFYALSSCCPKPVEEEKSEEFF